MQTVDADLDGESTAAMHPNTWICLPLALAFVVACGDDSAATDASTATNGSVTSTTSSSTSAAGGGDAGGSDASGGGQAQGGAAGVGGAGGTMSAGTVSCAGEMCGAGEVCCFNNVSKTQVRCDAVGACDANDIELSCDHPDDCGAGATCCSAFNGMVLTMVCQADCSAGNEFVMCSGPDQSACPNNTTCIDAQAGEGYHYCAK